MSQTPGSPDSINTGGGQQSRPPVDPFAAVSAPPPPPPPGYGPYAYPPPPPRGQSIASRIMTGLITSLLLLSLLFNVYLVIALGILHSGPAEQPYEDGDKSQRIIVLPVTGVIDEGSARFVHEALKSLENNLPKAIILRVESGGGGVSPSDVIWHELAEFRKKHGEVPIVASYGGIAASGGYYISAGSDYIIAEPTCITGSIGVIAPAFTVDKMLEKIGVTPEVITATPSTKKDVANNIMRPWNDEDRTVIRELLDHMATRFIDVVYQGRKSHLKLEEVKELAHGQIFNADEAVQAKLIDEVGYLDRAIEKAKELAKISPTASVQVNVLHRPGSLGLLSLLGSHGSLPTESLNADEVRSFLSELATPRVEYRMAP